jgi:signal transduction histidine kinase
METHFALPERALQEELDAQISKVASLSFLENLTRVIPDGFMILNRHRQIVYCNDALVSALGINGPEDIYGLRPGEAIKCIHSEETPGGCGTSRFCRYCGAVNAIVDSQDDRGTVQEQECRLTAEEGAVFFDFLVRAETIELAGEIFTFTVMRDNSSEKRRNILERIFFHDILNTAGGIRGLLELMKDATPDEINEFLDLAESSSNALVEEINAQRDMLAAENGNLEIEMYEVNSLEVLSSVIAVYKKHPVSSGKVLQLDEKSVSENFVTDPRLLSRVLGNMTKNALEAEPEGNIVTIGSSLDSDGHLQFWVHNPSEMPESAKMQVFQRSFSTKGKGRGLGTYSIKLLSETYLDARVEFTSEKESGTVFRVIMH